MADDSDSLLEKWGSLLDVVPEGNQGMVAQLLENQAQHLATRVRRVFPRTLAQDIVSVQPMTRQTGFVMDYVYADPEAPEVEWCDGDVVESENEDRWKKLAGVEFCD